MSIEQVKVKIKYYKCFRDEKSVKLTNLYKKLLTHLTQHVKMV